MLNSQTITLEQLAKTIDHSLLKPEMTLDDVIAGCQLAKEYKTRIGMCAALRRRQMRRAAKGKRCGSRNRHRVSTWEQPYDSKGD